MTPDPYSVFCLTDRKAIVPLPWVPNRLLVCEKPTFRASAPLFPASATPCLSEKSAFCASVPGFLPEHLLSVRKAGVPLTRSCRCLPSAGLQGTVYTADPALSPFPNASAIWSRRFPQQARPRRKGNSPSCRSFSLLPLQAFLPLLQRGQNFF